MIDLVNVGYKTEAEVQILKEINCTIKPGEFVVVTGASGSGKSTLFNLLNGLSPELYEGSVTGDGLIGTSKVPITNFSEHVQQLGVVFQNPKTHFFTTDVFSELAFVMENYGFHPETIRTRVEDILHFFEIEEFSDASMFRLSGGQRQMISIAAANMIAHKLLLLDEPSSNLDFEAVQKLKKALFQLKRQGITILIAEHRLAYLMDLADRFFIMENGHIASDIPKESMQIMSEEVRKNAGLRSLKPLVLNKKREFLSEKKETITLDIHNLVCKYRKQTKNALEVSQIRINNKYITGIIGENGAGKSTFFDAISGLIRPKSGDIRLNGQLLSRKQLLNQTFLVMQDVNLQLFFETVEKELLTHAKNKGRYDEICEKFHLTHLLNRHPHTLSGGEKQRVAIATAILSGKKVLLFDEPTSGLDYKHMKEVSKLLQSLDSEDVLIIVVSHDEEFLQETCQTIIQLEQGKFVSK